MQKILDEEKKVSDTLVSLIDMVFAVAIGISITIIFEENIFLLPSLQTVTLILSLLTVYTAVILSWIFYHKINSQNRS